MGRRFLPSALARTSNLRRKKTRRKFVLVSVSEPAAVETSAAMDLDTGRRPKCLSTRHSGGEPIS